MPIKQKSNWQLLPAPIFDSPERTGVPGWGFIGGDLARTSDSTLFVGPKEAYDECLRCLAGLCKMPRHTPYNHMTESTKSQISTTRKGTPIRNALPALTYSLTRIAEADDVSRHFCIPPLPSSRAAESILSPILITLVTYQVQSCSDQDLCFKSPNFVSEI
jgi:hypothetical protein